MNELKDPEAAETVQTTSAPAVDLPRLVRLRWRKESIRYGPNTHKLSRGGEWLAVVQECKGGWFWYGGGRNTAGNPTDLETAKSEAMAHIKSIEANETAQTPPDSGTKDHE